MSSLILLASLLIFVFLTILVIGLVSLTFSQSVTGFLNATGTTTTVNDSFGVEANQNVAAAQPGILSVRTSNTAGTITMNNSSHGIITGQRVDLYWNGGQCYGAVVGTVSGTSVPIASVSGGSNLPVANSAITVGVATSSPFVVAGSNVSALVVHSATANAYVVFNTGGADTYAAYVVAGNVIDWYTGGAGSNPLTGASITLVYMSHSDTAGAHTDIKAAALAH